jgi:predicted enzyme related to lactoylglutathione lyase
MDSVIHFEIPADDTGRAEEFYSRAFGWAMKHMPEFEYTIITTTPSDEMGIPTQPGSINGGMPKRGLGADHPVITIRVDDIDSKLQKIEKLGGKSIAPKMPVADMGFTAYFQDTEGNIVGLWQDAKM